MCFKCCGVRDQSLPSADPVGGSVNQHRDVGGRGMIFVWRKSRYQKEEWFIPKIKCVYFIQKSHFHNSSLLSQNLPEFDSFTLSSFPSLRFLPFSFTFMFLPHRGHRPWLGWQVTDYSGNFFDFLHRCGKCSLSIFQYVSLPSCTAVVESSCVIFLSSNPSKMLIWRTKTIPSA